MATGQSRFLFKALEVCKRENQGLGPENCKNTKGVT